MTEAHNAGEIIGTLRLDADQWIRKARETSTANLQMAASERAAATAADKVEAAETRLAKARASGRQDRITAAERNLTAVRRQAQTATDRVVLSERKLNDELAKNEQHTKNAELGMRGLWKAALLVAPALIPIGAAAAAAFGAFAAGAGTALLALKGIQAQMKAGTTLGQQYSAAFKGISTDFAQLSQTAAQGVSGGVFQSIKDVHSVMPELNRETATYSSILGEAGEHVVHGLLSGFTQLSPLFTQILHDASGLADAFDRYASGGGLQKFGAWTQANLPAIEEDLTNIAEIVGKVIAASADAGVSLLSVFGAFARALNAIPLPVLKVLAPILIAAYTANTILGATAKLTTAALGSQLAVTLGLTRATQGLAAAEGEAAVASRGAGLAGAGAALGAAAGPITAAVAVGTLGHAALDQQAKKPGLLGRIANAAISVPGLGPAHVAGGKTPVAGQSAIDAGASPKNVAAILAASAAHKQLADSVAQAAAAQKLQTAQMVLENDAAGLLSQSLGKLGGNNLGVAEATTQNAQATKDATTALHENGDVIAGNSDKALKNQSALQGAASSAIALAEAVAKQTGSTEKSNASLAASKKKLEDSLRSQGLLTDAVQAYIDKLFKIPARRKTAIDLAADRAKRDLAALQRQIDNLHGKTVGVTILHYDTKLGRGAGMQEAEGGQLHGPGTGTSDSIPIMASNKEFVVNAKQTQKFLPVLHAINAGYAGGGSVTRSGPSNAGAGGPLFKLTGRVALTDDGKYLDMSSAVLELADGFTYSHS